jgi:hypothetical protein
MLEIEDPRPRDLTSSSFNSLRTIALRLLEEEVNAAVRGSISVESTVQA